MYNAKIAEFIFNGYDFFAAHLENGGVRVGLKGYACIDFPASHPLYAKACALTEANAEEFYDAQVEAGLIPLY